MVRVTFYRSRKALKGFRMEGHSGYAEQGRDIICASLSSAAYMTVNTITDVIGDRAEITVSPALMKLRVDTDDERTLALLEGFRLHVEALSQEYPSFISCRTFTVKE